MSRKTGFTIMIEDKELNKQLDKALKRNPKATARAVMDCLLDLAGESARRAPVETGDLRNDCTATLNGSKVFAKQAPTGIAPGNLRAHGDVSYGLPYALRQHEELNYSHTRTDGYLRKDGTSVNMVAGGEAKFLEKPFEERKGRYIKRIEKIPEETLK